MAAASSIITDASLVARNTIRRALADANTWTFLVRAENCQGERTLSLTHIDQLQAPFWAINRKLDRDGITDNLD
jgi:hypothetical protein